MEASYKKYEKLRKKKGVTNYRVSKETGVAQTSISDWKLGKQPINKIKSLSAIAEYLGVSIEDLIA